MIRLATAIAVAVALAAGPAAAATRTVIDQKTCSAAVRDAKAILATTDSGPRHRPFAADLLSQAETHCAQNSFDSAENTLFQVRLILATE